MYRVITKFRDRNGEVMVEKGPWHPHWEAAEQWAEILRGLGYQAEVVSQGGHHDSGDGDLAKALANMA